MTVEEFSQRHSYKVKSTGQRKLPPNLEAERQTDGQVVTGRSSPGGGRGAQPHLQVPEAEGNRGWGTGMVWAGLAESGREGLSPRKEAGSGDGAGSGQMESGDIFRPERRPLQTCAPTQPSPNLTASLQSRGKSLGEKREGRQREIKRDSPEQPRLAPEVSPRSVGPRAQRQSRGIRSHRGGKASSHSRPGEARALTV